ncbi:flagellar biosynthesis protein FlhF [Sporolactobacillus sp. THM7-7]|nr:flagellar biosynthesis protein FlhF [Sporolactobacillus sp. THM7-7]
MKMKKIIAPTMAQAIEKVKEELGSDAVIFHTKKVTRGRFFNLFRKENVEVLAASDPEPSLPLKKSVNHPEEKDKEAFSPFAYQRTPSYPWEADRLFTGPACMDKIRDQLTKQGLVDDHIYTLMKALVKKWYQRDEKLTEKELAHLLKAQLTRMLDPLRFQHSPLPERFVMLVGSTGVGKTTTIAKLAGRAFLEEGKKIAFVTADTFRIAAIEQLKTYAGILDAPVQVAYDEDDFHHAVEKFSSYDYVFIDTAGRNFHDEKYIDDIGGLVRSAPKLGLYLVVSATAKFDDIDTMIGRFGRLNVNKLIVSKMDETRTYGPIVSALIRHPELTMTYVANGQNVPDDLRAADCHELVRHLLGDLYEE